MNFNFLSSNQLLDSQKSCQTFPEYGRPKLNDVISRDQQDEDAFQRYMDERKSCLSEAKCSRLSSLIQGQFNLKKGMIKVHKLKGKGVQHLGYHCSVDGRVFYPEEALYLMDCKRMEVYYNRLPLSMQEAFSVMLTNINLQSRYLVYSYLSGLGYGVLRYNQRLSNCESKTTVSIEEVQIDEGTSEATFSSRIRVSQKPHSFKNEPCLLARFPDIEFPNTYKMETYTKQLFADSSLYPPGVCVITQDIGSGDDPPCKRSRFENPKSNKSLKENNWSYYKNISLKKCRENVLISSAARPIIDYRHSTSTGNVLQKLNSMVKDNFTEPQVVSPKFAIDYDVYLPTDLKRGSLKNQSPHHHLIVTNQSDSLPLPCDIDSLMNGIDDSVPIQFGVVDNGDVAFYSFHHVRLKPEN